MTSLDQHNAQTLTAISGMVHARPKDTRPLRNATSRDLVMELAHRWPDAARLLASIRAAAMTPAGEEADDLAEAVMEEAEHYARAVAGDPIRCGSIYDNRASYPSR